MRVKEKQAKKKKCCQPELTNFDFCLGSNCMAWRWCETSNPMKPYKYGYCGIGGPLDGK